MTNPAINAAVAAAIAAAAKDEDQSKVVVGGGEYKPPAAGPCFARLVGYFELGKEDYTYQNQPKVRDNVELVFELFGKNHPPVETTVDGVTVKTPVRITVKINKSLGENGAWRKLFAKLNWAQDITHAAQALGRAFKVTVFHSEGKAAEGKKAPVYANLNDANKEFHIGAPRLEVTDEDGEISYKTVDVPQPLTEIKCFIWEHCDKTMWDSIYIPGSYPEKKDDKGNITQPARTKNVIQEKIKKAKNFIGSPAHAIVCEAGEDLQIPDSDAVPERSEEAVQASADAKTGASEDPLGGL